MGGEARARARRAEKAGTPAPETAQPGAVPDVRHRSGRRLHGRAPRSRPGLVQPVLQYALIENALGAAEGQAVDDHGRPIADLWERFNLVARTNPAAAFRPPRSAAELATPSAQNRPLAFPYNKWHASQWTVDQAAALVLCSAEAARAHGVPPDRWVFPLVGLDASHALSLSRRRHLAPLAGHGRPRTGGGRRASAAPSTRSSTSSSTPASPRPSGSNNASSASPRRETPTVTGGMAFAGGPFNNFVYQATAALVPLLRAQTRRRSAW